MVAQRLFFDSFRSLFDFVNSKVFFLSQIGFAQILSFYKSGKGYLKTKALLLRGLIDIRQLFLKIYGPYNMVNHIYYSCSKLIILKHLLTTNASSPVNHFSHFEKMVIQILASTVFRNPWTLTLAELDIAYTSEWSMFRPFNFNLAYFDL